MPASIAASTIASPNGERTGFGDLQRPADAVEIVGAALLVLGLLEERQDAIPVPALAAALAPAVVIGRGAAHVDHAVDRAGAAQHLAARLVEGAAVELRLGLALEHPVDPRIGVGLGVAERDMDPRVAVGRQPRAAARGSVPISLSRAATGHPPSRRRSQMKSKTSDACSRLVLDLRAASSRPTIAKPRRIGKGSTPPFGPRTSPKPILLQFGREMCAGEFPNNPDELNTWRYCSGL